MALVKKYSSEIPNETKGMIKAIDNDTSYAIMMCLSKEGKLPHNQLKEKLGLDDKALRKGIVRLEYGGLVNELAPIYFEVDKETKKPTGINTGTIEKTDYEITELGSDFLKAIKGIWELPKKQ